jgi:hypothetical protein
MGRLTRLVGLICIALVRTGLSSAAISLLLRWVWWRCHRLLIVRRRRSISWRLLGRVHLLLSRQRWGGLMLLWGILALLLWGRLRTCSEALLLLLLNTRLLRTLPAVGISARVRWAFCVPMAHHATSVTRRVWRTAVHRRWARCRVVDHILDGREACSEVRHALQERFQGAALCRRQGWRGWCGCNRVDRWVDHRVC